MLTDLIAALHENTGAAIRAGKNKSARLETTSGVRQGCILAPALFCVAIDCILNHMTMRPSINIGSSSFSDLVYADDTAFFIKDATDATDCLSSFSHSSSVFGLHTSWPKTKLQSVGSDSGPDLLNVVVDGNPVDLGGEFHLQVAVSKRLTDTAGQTSHVELVSRPRQCRHSVTSGIRNIFLFRRKFVFIKHWFYQSCCMHPKRGPHLPVT